MRYLYAKVITMVSFGPILGLPNQKLHFALATSLSNNLDLYNFANFCHGFCILHMHTF